MTGARDTGDAGGSPADAAAAGAPETMAANGTRPARLFVALWPPFDVVATLGAQVTWARKRASRDPTLAAVTSQLRWTAPEQWHLTLAFLGTVEAGRTAELSTRLARAAARHRPLTVRFHGAGRFGDRVIFAALDGDRDGVSRLAASARAAARRTGIPVEERRYRPHLTLARHRPGRTGRVELGPVARLLADLDGPTWVADRLDLVRSDLGAGPERGSAYTSLDRWPLGNTP